MNLISLLYFPLSLSPFSTLFLPLAICLTLAYSLTHSLPLSLPRHLSPAISCSLLLSLSIFLYLAIYLALALFCFLIITISRMFSPFFSLCLARPIWLSKYHSLSRYLALSRFLLLPLLLSGSDQFSCMPSYYISHALHFSPKHSLVISLSLILDISTSLTFLLSRSLLFFRYIFYMLALTLSHHLFFSCCLSRYLSLPLTFYPTSLSLATPPLSLSALSPCVVLSLYLCISLIIFSVCHFHALYLSSCLSFCFPSSLSLSRHIFITRSLSHYNYFSRYLFAFPLSLALRSPPVCSLAHPRTPTCSLFLSFSLAFLRSLDTYCYLFLPLLTSF